MRSRKAESKPLSFSTTMRNPNRIVSFLNCLLPYENQILTHDVIMKVVHNAIKEKLYTPVIVNRTPDLSYILKNDDEKYSDRQIDFIIEMSPQKHKEAGFEYGWDSRFDTIFKLPMEFGFRKRGMSMTENDRLTVKNKMWNGVEIYELKDSCPNVYGIQRLGEYEEVGTVEECRTAVERMKPKKPVVKYGCTYRCPPDCGGEEFDEYGDVYHCPNCDRELSYSLDDVCRCGQAIDWRK